jgi:hypothetical protein
VPSKEQHVNKAKQNEKFCDDLDGSSQASINWKLVVLFYAGLHYVEAYLAKSMNQHTKSHTTRDNCVSRESNLRRIRTQYNHLKFYGFNARYEVDQFTTSDVTDAQAYLKEVREIIIPLL